VTGDSPQEPLNLTVDEVASLTGRHPYVVRRWIREGVLPAVKLTNQQGQPYSIRAADLAVLAHRRRWHSKTPPATVPHRLAAAASITGAIRRDA
jgi:excisionase family DNA binding protein